ncbi:probable inorganic phosphate transporter 1-9 [Corylus avellana]|uniref:probable inorganic phosphate transporter 1-9 n=1 Tax=Corylus avellana TaxID=13451 RepID=UPI00286CEB17|nr:probable inorganic phosphate transporter 1-9 [Corylus avellana]
MALKVLSALDTAKTQYYHIKAIIIAGMGLFTDAYDLFCILPIMGLIGRVYYESESDDSNKYKVRTSVTSTMLAIALLGTAIGQLVFGRLGDLVGRRRVYGIALMIMVLSSIGCGFSICTTRNCVLVSLGLFRFILGLGIGGDYPLSATIMSEFANKTTRGALIAAVFSMQGLGILTASVVTMTVCRIFDATSDVHVSAMDPTPQKVDIAWRLILMLGAIPAALTFYWRMLMPETARYTALVEQNVAQAAKDMEKVLEVSLSQIAEEYPLPPNEPPYPLFSKQFFRRHGRDLFASSCTWFLVDIVFYSSNLFQSQIYKHLPDRGKNAYQDAFEVAKIQAIFAASSTIPGYWVTVCLIDRLGRVKIQTMGFLLMAAFYLSIGIPYIKHWQNHLDLGYKFLYGFIFFFSNFGPNTTTFIVPAELFPARFRSTCHGISGAAGKVGAVIGSVGIYSALQVDRKENGDPNAIIMSVILVILAGVCVMGGVVTYLFTRETMGRSLEENETDNDEEAKEMCLFRCLTDTSVNSPSSSAHILP